MCIFSHYWKEEDILLNFQFWAINNFYLRCLQRLGIAMPNPRAYVQVFPEEALQFAWSRIWVNLVPHSRWECSNLEFVPGTLQLYNPFTRFVLVYIFFKAKYTSHPSKQILMFSIRNRLHYLPVIGGVSSNKILQKRAHSAPQTVHWHYKWKFIQYTEVM